MTMSTVQFSTAKKGKEKKNDANAIIADLSEGSIKQEFYLWNKFLIALLINGAPLFRLLELALA